MGELLVKRKMVSSLVDKFSIRENSTIKSLIDRIDMNQVLHDYLSVSLEGEYISKEDWETRIAGPHNTVRVTVVPATGDSGKSGLAAIAMIALTVFTYGQSSWALGSLASSLEGGALIAAQAGVMFVGTLLIQAIFPPSAPKTSGFEDSSGFLGIGGLKNQARPHGAIRNIYGTYRVAPDLAAEVYIVTTERTQTMYSLLDFGYGLVDIEDMRIANTIANQYRGLAYKLLQNFTTEDQWLIDHPEDDVALEYYANDNVTESTAIEIRNVSYVEHTFPSDETKEGVITLKFPIGLNATSRSKAYRPFTVAFKLYYSREGEEEWIPASDSVASTSMPVTWDTNYADSMYFTNLYTEVPSTCTYNCYGTDCNDGYSFIESGRTVFQVSSVPTTTILVIGAQIVDAKPIYALQTFVFLGIVYTISEITQLANTTKDIIILEWVDDGQGSGSLEEVTYTETVLNYEITLDKPLISDETHILYIPKPVTIIVIPTSLCFPNHGTEDGDYFALTSPSVSYFELNRIEIKPFSFSMNLVFPDVGDWKFRIIRIGSILYDHYDEDETTKYSDRTDLESVRSVTVRSPVSFKVPHTIMTMKVISTDQLNGVIDTLTVLGHRNIRYWVSDATILNGTFDTNTTSWGAGSSAILTSESGRLRVAYNGTEFPYAQQIITVELGKTYRITGERFDGPATSGRIDVDIDGVDGLGNLDSGELIFTPMVSTSVVIQLYAMTGTVDEYAEFDNIAIEEGWVIGRTSNPAWIALDILTGVANPDAIPDERVDLASFKEWAHWCNLASVQSPTTAKYQADCNWDSMSTVYERLSQVMSAGRATFSFRDNLYSVIYDQFPTIPVQMFTPINSWNFSANRTFAKQPHALNISFVDPESEWQQIDRIVYADGYAEVDDEVGGLNCFDSDGDPVDCTAATYFESIDLPLCTRSDEAWRNGRYYLAQGILRPETFTITTDIENLVCERGDFVTVQHDVSKSGGQPSRITDIIIDVTGDVFTLHDDIPYVTGEVNKIRVRFSNKDQDEFTVHTDTETLPDPNTVKITTTGTNAQVGDLIVYGVENLVTDEFLIKSISPSKDLSATLEMVPIARAIETSDTGTIPDYNPQIVDIKMTYPYPLDTATISTTVILYYKNRMPVVDCTLEWPELGSNVKYEIWVSADNSGYYEFKENVNYANTYNLWVEKSTLDADYFGGQYLAVKIVPVNSYGLKPQLESCDPVIIMYPYDITKPSKPLFFAGNITEQTISLTWLPPSDEDIGGYILKYTPNIDNPTWDNSTAEGNMIPYSATTVDVNARIGSYMMKTIDTSGNISDAHALVKTTIPEISKMNLLEESIEDPLFTGTMTSVELVDGGIQLIETGTEGSYVSVGTYALNTLFDVEGIFRCYLTSQIEGKTVENYPISNWDTMTERESMSQAGLGEWNAVVQVRTASINGSMSDWTLLEDAVPLAQSSDWGGWQNLTAGFYTGRYFQFRVVLTTISGYSTPHINKLKVTVDAPDRTEYGNDLIISELVNPDKLPVSTDPLDGHYVEFSKPFFDKPVIGITQDNAIDGQYYVIRNIANEGFDIEFYTSDDSVGFEDDVVDEVQFDFTAKGYGEQESTYYNAIEAGEDDDINQLPTAITTYLIL